MTVFHIHDIYSCAHSPMFLMFILPLIWNPLNILFLDDMTTAGNMAASKAVEGINRAISARGDSAVYSSYIHNKFKREEHMRDGSGNTQSAAKAGIGFGACLAIVISWSLHQSLLWAIFHGILGWFYVIFYAFTR